MVAMRVSVPAEAASEAEAGVDYTAEADRQGIRAGKQAVRKQAGIRTAVLAAVRIAAGTAGPSVPVLSPLEALLHAERPVPAAAVPEARFLPVLPSTAPLCAMVPYPVPSCPSAQGF